MRLFLLFSIISFFGCSGDPKFTKFEYDNYSLEYPSSWKTYEVNTVNLFISKYDTSRISNDQENPALMITSFDSINFTDNGILSISDFANDLKLKMQSWMTSATLEKDFSIESINNTEWQTLKFKIVGEYNIITQKYYFHNKMGKYIIINTTEIYGKRNPELAAILNSVHISDYEPLDLLIDLTDSI